MYDWYLSGSRNIDPNKIVLPKGTAVIPPPNKVTEIRFTNGSVIKGLYVESKPIRGIGFFTEVE